MTNGEGIECLLCGARAERHPFSDVAEQEQTDGGWKYICPNCGTYALPEQEHHWIENYCSEDQRLKLFEYLRDNPVEEGTYKVFTMEEIERVLRAHPPGEP